MAECVEAGAVGLVHKSEPFDAFIDAVARTAELRTTLSRTERDDLLRALAEQRAADEERDVPFARLTAREQAVLAGLMDGLSAAELADRDFVALSTVRSQIRSVLTKLGVSSQLAAVAVARAASWRPGDS
ncbi:MAG: LuxR C-terminal-related transcriptional regulator [Acidimicrobiales bacterium]|nr:LuxR C-terminal-related transcriptional regulator [Acidimicrobiales bacterium]